MSHAHFSCQGRIVGPFIPLAFLNQANKVIPEWLSASDTSSDAPSFLLSDYPALPHEARDAACFHRWKQKLDRIGPQALWYEGNEL